MSTRKVTTRQYSWLQRVRQVDPKTDREDPPEVYHFGGGRRRFKDSGPNGGPYG